MKNDIGTKYTFLGTKSTEKVLKSDEKFCTQKFHRSSGTVCLNYWHSKSFEKSRLERNHHFSAPKLLKTAENC